MGFEVAASLNHEVVASFRHVQVLIGTHHIDL
jgi:hypothetical protein